MTRLTIFAFALMFISLTLTMPAHAQAAASGDKVFILPVLVQVNDAGKVVAVDPALHLPAALQELLNQAVKEVIKRSSGDCHGKCVGGTAVMQLVMHVKPAAHGDFSVNFEYRAMRPLAGGPWHWCLTYARRTASHPYVAYLTPGDKHARCALHPSGRAYAFGRWNTATAGWFNFGASH